MKKYSLVIFALLGVLLVSLLGLSIRSFCAEKEGWNYKKGWYYLFSDGTYACSEYIDGYWLDASGWYDHKGGDFKSGSFLVGKGQSRKNCDDVRHPGQKVGEGVYCTPDIKVAEGYAGQSSEVNGKRYKMVFMMRVKPDRIRTSKERPQEWILDGTTDEMRPYRIMIK